MDRGIVALEQGVDSLCGLDQIIPVVVVVKVIVLFRTVPVGPQEYFRAGLTIVGRLYPVALETKALEVQPSPFHPPGEQYPIVRIIFQAVVYIEGRFEVMYD